jgi:hypothetical protein
MNERARLMRDLDKAEQRMQRASEQWEAALAQVRGIRDKLAELPPVRHMPVMDLTRPLELPDNLDIPMGPGR